MTAPQVSGERTRRRHAAAEGTKSVAGSFVTLILLAAFLSPLVRVTLTALKTDEQVTELGAPLWPAKPRTFTFEGETYEVFRVPTEAGVREWALVRKGRLASDFMDPGNPGAGPITWQGSWRTLDHAWEWAPAWSNFAEVWTLLDYPRLLFNTAALAGLSLIGVLISCTLVAYGFARFRIPGKGLLFTLLIATIFLPSAVTLIPTYTIFVKLGWVGTWLPLIVPAFFANAYDVFLLRQFFLTLPRELDEAAMMDGASPLRILWSIIIPQSYPVLVAVTVFHIVFAWNDYFGPLIYLSTNRQAWPISVALPIFNGLYNTEPQLIQAGALMAMVLPLILFFVAQRFFIQGIVVTGVEK